MPVDATIPTIDALKFIAQERAKVIDSKYLHHIYYNSVMQKNIDIKSNASKFYFI